MEKKSNIALQTKLDNQQFNTKDLVELRLPLNLPYITDWKEFENNLVKYANMDEFQINLNNSVITSTNILEKEAKKLRDIILKAVGNIPKKRVTEYSKC